MLRISSLSLAGLALFAGLASIASASTVTSPYLVDFDDGTAGSLTLSSNTSDSFVVANGQLTFTKTQSQYQYSAASVEIDGSSTAAFDESVQVTLGDPFNYSASAVSLNARSDNQALGSIYDANASFGYTATISVGFDTNYVLTLEKSGNSLGSIDLPYLPENSSLLSLTGTPQPDGDLFLTASLLVGATPYTVTATDSAAGVLADPSMTYFGFKEFNYDSTGNGISSSPLVAFDNYAVSAAVPEPMAMSGLVGLAAMAMRRRRV